MLSRLASLLLHLSAQTPPNLDLEIHPLMLLASLVPSAGIDLHGLVLVLAIVLRSKTLAQASGSQRLARQHQWVTQLLQPLDQLVRSRAVQALSATLLR